MGIWGPESPSWRSCPLQFVLVPTTSLRPVDREPACDGRRVMEEFPSRTSTQCCTSAISVWFLGFRRGTVSLVVE